MTCWSIPNFDRKHTWICYFDVFSHFGIFFSLYLVIYFDIAHPFQSLDLRLALVYELYICVSHFKLPCTSLDVGSVNTLAWQTIHHASPKPGPQPRALLWCCVCIINSYNALLNWPIVSLLTLFILFSMFFVLIHEWLYSMIYWFSLLQF